MIQEILTAVIVLGCIVYAVRWLKPGKKSGCSRCDSCKGCSSNR